MKYLIAGYGNGRGSCYGINTGNCTCNNGSYSAPCGLKNEQDKACPKHCWVLVCSTAKVDPFGLNS